MNKFEADALNEALTFASEAETILEVAGVEGDLAAVERGDLLFSDVTSRDFTIVDGATVAAMLINLFMWIGQIRRGQFMRNASRDEIIQDLSVRVLSNDTLSGAAKERLLSRALDRISNEKEP